ncbi:MAG: hypothetical protein KC912_17535 [Proteobacteria bacterium]|nr:hypothetical protein [Pseudomonadota bacterium]
MLWLALSLFSPAHAAPGHLPIQGVLADNVGAPIDGDVTVKFRLVSDDVGTTEFWTETVTVAAVGGRFAINLGDVADLDLDLFATYPGAYLGVKVGTDAEMPLVALGHVGYAAWAENAGDADLLEGRTRTEIASDIISTANGLYAPVTYAPDWSELTSVPTGLADGDDDTTYTAGTGLALSSGGEFSLNYTPDFGDLTSVPTGLADGDDDTTYTAGSGLALASNGEFSLNYTPDFSDLTSVPTGLADGDDDTTYTAGTGIALANGQFTLDYTPDWGDLTGVPTDVSSRNAATLEGQAGAYYLSANNLTGTVGAGLFSAYADLAAESKIGTGGTQVAAGNHTHNYAASGHNHDSDYADISHTHGRPAASEYTVVASQSASACCPSANATPIMGGCQASDLATGISKSYPINWANGSEAACQSCILGAAVDVTAIIVCEG